MDSSKAATISARSALFQAHIPTYYLAVTADGHLTMFGAYRHEHPIIHDFRAAHHPNVFDSGLDTLASAAGFAADIANGGDWIDGRMLCSGPRTNPWYQEASARDSKAETCLRSTPT